MNETSPTPSCSRCGAPLTPDALKGLCPRCLMALNLAAPTEIPGETGPHGTKVVKPPPALDEIAKHFPQFEILECLGRGGMGVVYKARQPKLNRIVALKILAPEKVAETKFAERFEREAQALARLNHPNIVTVYDFGEADGLYYLTMEFVDGVSLRQLLQTRKIAPEEALAIVPKICEALQFAHEQGVVHRDIKPENVLLDKQGRVKIADFGIAKIVGDVGQTFLSAGSGDFPVASVAGVDAGLESPAHRQAGKPAPPSLTADQVLGTPHYMAPEQVEKPAMVDHRADIYSLGVVFYEMLTGELPLGKFQPPSKKVQVDVRLDEVVLHALEKEPERRYQQASEVKTDVERISGTPPASPGAGDVRPASGGAALPPLAPRQDVSTVSFTAESVRTQFVIMAVAWWVGMPLSALSDLLPPPGNLAVGMLCLPPLIVATVFWCILLYRHWSLLQGHGARTTPGKGVGFGFIPFYCFYWWFVAYAGLATDNNRHLDQAGITTARMSRGLAITSCILGILGCTIGLIPVAGVVVWIPYMIVGFILVLQQRECVLAILQQRNGTPAAASASSAGASQPKPADRGNWRKMLAIVAAVVLVVVAIPPAVTFLSLTVLKLTQERAISPALVVAVEQKLRGEIQQRLAEGGWRADFSVTVSPDLRRAECRVAKFWRNGLRVVPPPYAAINLQPQGGGLWQVRGEGELQSLRFSVDTSAEMTAAIRAPGAAGKQSDAGPALESAAQTPSFGQVVEVVLPFGAPCLNHYLQFRSGQGFTIGRGPATTKEEFDEDWRRAEAAGGVDASAIRLQEGVQFIGEGCIFTREHGPNWEATAAGEVLSQLEHASWMSGVVEPKTKDFPVTYLFKTARGECGLVQLLEVVPDERGYAGAGKQGHGLKLRYKLVQTPGDTPAASLAGADLRRKFVRLVVEATQMTFEGQPTTWDDVGALLANVPERANTVLEFAVTSDQITVAQQNEWFQKAGALARQHGFEYASFIGIHPLGSKGTSARPTLAVPPITRARPGEFTLTLPNGVSVEVVAVTRKPAENKLWWKPDGTPLPEPPGARLTFLPTGMNEQMPNGEDDLAIWVRLTPPPLSQMDAHWQSRLRYSPTGESLGLLRIHPDSRVTEAVAGLKRLGRMIAGEPGGPKASGNIVGRAEAVRFPPGTQEVAVQCTTAVGPWEALAVFDGKQTRVLVEGTRVLCTHLRQDANGKCLDVTHDVDRERYALRMVAVFKDGKREAVGLHSGVLSARETQGYVLLEPGQRVEDIQEFVLERTPWVRGEIKGVALKPNSSSAKVAPAFGPVIERQLRTAWDAAENKVLDLDAGRLLSVPPDVVKASANNPRPLLKWMVKHGADLLVTDGPSSTNLDFRDAAAGDFSLRSDSATAKAGLGARIALGAASPWPLQPEEKAIIPEGETRDSRQWKRPGGI